jgi:AraC-like DNA-binding protein
MDALSDVLRIVRLRGGVFLEAEFTAPWCISSRIRPGDLGSVLDDADHVVLYHYVAEGRVTAQLPGRPAMDFDAGEVLILPNNDEHKMGSSLALPATPHNTIPVKVRPEDGLMIVRHGGGGEKTRIVCGYLSCDKLDGNPLAAALPPMLRFDTRRGSSAAWMRSSLEFVAAEIAERRAGSETILAKLSELMFVEALRRHVDSLPPEQTGWLAGLKDPYVSRALALLHGQVSRQWSVEDLAREVALSRSALADRFTRLIGEPPMRYLARWRIQLAAHQLRHTDTPLVRIAEGIGYESETAFNRAFKRSFGAPPATWRRNNANGGRSAAK